MYGLYVNLFGRLFPNMASIIWHGVTRVSVTALCAVWKWLYSYFGPVTLVIQLCIMQASFCGKTIREKLRDRRGMRDVGTQVALDGLVINPVVYWRVTEQP